MVKKKKKVELINREISWLGFNERVLQEAEDSSVPLIERVRFLGIFSNNLDEFYRVRVASLKRMIAVRANAKLNSGETPNEILDKILSIAIRQQNRFQKIYDKLIKLLSEENVFVIDEKALNKRQGEFVKDYFHNIVRPSLVPVMLDKKRKIPFLKDSGIFLGIKLGFKDNEEGSNHALIAIPSNISRFLVLPQEGAKKYVILLDDVIRYNLQEIFSIFRYDKIEARTFKITRDAELDIDDDIGTGLLERMEKSLEKRKKGEPVRFVYDAKMPEDLLNHITKQLQIKKDEIIPGGRYHNFKDFIDFPNVGTQHLRHQNLPPLKVKEFEEHNSLLKCIKKQDILVNYPYQKFDYVIDLLREAAIDPKVKSIKINLYRVARNSKIINALINAVHNGKDVTAIVELKARFDEENNIHWSNKLQDAGVKVITGVTGLKVHAKLILITRKEDKKTAFYAHVGTGNFHESTAKIYGDHSLFTADERITKEVNKVFVFFDTNYQRGVFRHLIVSPFNSRRKLNGLIDKEIKNAKSAKQAYIVLKINNLVDEGLIRKLYEASNAGVEIKLVVRGVCALIPGVPGMSEKIKVISIVDRFLEHARIFVFCNNGKELYYISSADWMTRNIDIRVEVTTPIYDEKVQKILRDLLDIQFRDNMKSRKIDKLIKNEYVTVKDTVGAKKTRSQIKTYKYFQSLLD